MSFNVNVFHAVAQIPAKYDVLFQAQTSLFLDRDWFALFNRHIVDASVRIYAVEQTSGEPVLLLLLQQSAHRLYSLSNYYTPYYAPIIQGDPDLVRAAIAYLLKFLSNDCHILQIQPMLHTSDITHWLQEGLKDAGFIVQDYFCFGNWRYPVGEKDFAAYAQALPSTLRNTLRRKENKLKRERDFSWRILTQWPQIKDHYAHYASIYSKSWKPDESHPEFIGAMAEHYAKNHKIRLGIAQIDGQVAAAQFWLVDHATASIFKLAYDPQFASYSIGSILTAKMMAHVIDVDHVQMIDYLSGDDPYKRDWMSQRREMWGVIAYNKKSLRARLLGYKSTFIRTIKRLIGVMWKN